MFPPVEFATEYDSLSVNPKASVKYLEPLIEITLPVIKEDAPVILSPTDTELAATVVVDRERISVLTTVSPCFLKSEAPALRFTISTGLLPKTTVAVPVVNSALFTLIFKSTSGTIS